MRYALRLIEPDDRQQAIEELSIILAEDIRSGLWIRAWDDACDWSEFLPLPQNLLNELYSHRTPLNKDIIDKSISKELSVLYRVTSADVFAMVVNLSFSHSEFPLAILPCAATKSDITRILYDVDYHGPGTYLSLAMDCDWFATVNAEMPDDDHVCLVAKDESPLWKTIDTHFKEEWSAWRHTDWLAWLKFPPQSG